MKKQSNKLTKIPNWHARLELGNETVDLDPNLHISCTLQHHLSVHAFLSQQSQRGNWYSSLMLSALSLIFFFLIQWRWFFSAVCIFVFIDMMIMVDGIGFLSSDSFSFFLSFLLKSDYLFTLLFNRSGIRVRYFLFFIFVFLSSMNSNCLLSSLSIFFSIFFLYPF